MPQPGNKTELRQLKPGPERQEAINHAAALLRAGGVAVIPTETVYGIVGSATEPATVKRIQELKEQSPDKPFQMLIGSIDQARELCVPLGRVAEKLMRLFWPGPLTLVLPATEGGTVGLRLPDHADTRAILRQGQVPLVASSANPHTEEPARDAVRARAYFDGKVDLILDGGQSPGGTPSTVAKVDGNKVTILRAGAIPERQLHRAARFRIVFMQPENHNRAALGAVICQHMLAQGPDEFDITLACPAPQDGERLLPEGARDELRHMGYPVDEISLTRTDPGPLACDYADAIFVTSERHRQTLAESMPALKKRLHLLRLDREEFPAPEHGGFGIGAGYRETAVQLEKNLWQICKHLIAEASA